MKQTEKLLTGFWAAVMSFAMGFGAVACLTSGIELRISYGALAIFCGVIAIGMAVFLSVPYGFALPAVAAVILCFRWEFWQQMRTIGAAIMERLTLGYHIPPPAFLDGEPAPTILWAAAFLAGVVIFLVTLSIIKRKTMIPAAAISLLIIAGTITVTDTVPDSKWLFLWGFGLVLLLLTHGAWHQSHAQGRRLSTIMLLPVAAVMVLLFVMVPPEAPHCWAVGDLAQQALDSMGQIESPIFGTSPGAPAQSLDLTSISGRFRRQTPVMEVWTDFDDVLYLRGRDYDLYTGTGWIASEGRLEQLLLPFPPGFTMFGGTSVLMGNTQVRTFSPLDTLYVPMYPDKTLLLTNGAVNNADARELYSFQCYNISSAELQADHIADFGYENYISLPEQTYIAARSWLEEQGIAGMELEQLPSAIEAAVRNSAKYDLATGNMPRDEQDLAMWFLNDSDTGYCVHFATAATVLLRSVGIPARYVEGYMVKTEASETITVREADAHAWVEYYNGSAWIILDATASGNSAESDGETTEPATTEPTTTQPTEPTEPAETQPTEFEETRPDDHTTQTKPVKEPFRLTWWMVTILYIAGAIVIVWGQYRLRRTLVLLKLEQKNPNGRGLAIFRQIRKICRFLKKDVPEASTELARKAKFSQHKLTKEELSILKSHLQKEEDALKQRPFFTRLFARLVFILL